jgi:hypothetical protein
MVKSIDQGMVRSGQVSGKTGVFPARYLKQSGRGSKGARHIPVPHRQRLAPKLARYKARPQSAPAADTAEITFGSFLERIDPRSKGCATAFRKIVADLLGLATDPAKFDYQSGGRDGWLAKIHGIRLSEITPAKIREWKQSFLAAVRDDPLALRKARISVNTLLRRSRSLFSRKVLRQLPLRLPSPLPNWIRGAPAFLFKALNQLFIS